MTDFINLIINKKISCSTHFMKDGKILVKNI